MNEKTSTMCPFTNNECNKDCALSVLYFDDLVCAFTVLAISAYEYKEIYSNKHSTYDVYEALGYNCTENTETDGQ